LGRFNFIILRNTIFHDQQRMLRRLQRPLIHSYVTGAEYDAALLDEAGEITQSEDEEDEEDTRKRRKQARRNAPETDRAAPPAVADPEVVDLRSDDEAEVEPQVNEGFEVDVEVAVKEAFVQCPICADEVAELHAKCGTEAHGSCIDCWQATVETRITDPEAMTVAVIPACCHAPSCTSTLATTVLCGYPALMTKYITHVEDVRGRQQTAAVAQAESVSHQKGYDAGVADSEFKRCFNKALDIVLIKCKKCAVPYYEWTSCGAVECANPQCRSQFCIACKKHFGYGASGSTAAHRHIYNGECESPMCKQGSHTVSRREYSEYMHAETMKKLKVLFSIVSIDTAKKIASDLYQHPIASQTLAMMKIYQIHFLDAINDD
jgi:hypothetical protein